MGEPTDGGGVGAGRLDMVVVVMSLLDLVLADIPDWMVRDPSP